MTLTLLSPEPRMLPGTEQTQEWNQLHCVMPPRTLNLSGGNRANILFGVSRTISDNVLLTQADV